MHYYSICIIIYCVYNVLCSEVWGGESSVPRERWTTTQDQEGDGVPEPHSKQEVRRRKRRSGKKKRGRMRRSGMMNNRNGRRKREGNRVAFK